MVYPWTLELFCFRPEDALGCFAFVGAGYQGVFQHLGLAPLHSNSQPDPHRFGGNVEAGLEGISAVAVIGSEDTFLLDPTHPLTWSLNLDLREAGVASFPGHPTI